MPQTEELETELEIKKKKTNKQTKQSSRTTDHDGLVPLSCLLPEEPFCTIWNINWILSIISIITVSLEHTLWTFMFGVVFVGLPVVAYMHDGIG